MQVIPYPLGLGAVDAKMNDALLTSFCILAQVSETFDSPPPSRSMASPSPKLKLGLPSGSLQDATLTLFERAGFVINGASRSYRPAIDDPEIEVRLLRAQEIGRYVDHGFLDCGVTGRDWIIENEAKVEYLCELPYSRATNRPTKWVLVVPEDSPIQRVEQLQGKRIATEAISLTRQFLASKGVTAELEFSWGATEVKVPELVDAIVDITETGNSLRANKLRILEVLLESYPQFIASPAAMSDPAKRQKIEQIALLLRGAINARGKVVLKMNLPKTSLDALVSTLPSLRRPTISQLADPDWLAVETVMDESVVREIIPQLKALGAEGIFEYAISKLVY